MPHGRRGYVELRSCHHCLMPGHLRAKCPMLIHESMKQAKITERQQKEEDQRKKAEKRRRRKQAKTPDQLEETFAKRQQRTYSAHLRIAYAAYVKVPSDYYYP